MRWILVPMVVIVVACGGGEVSTGSSVATTPSVVSTSVSPDTTIPPTTTSPAAETTLPTTPSKPSLTGSIEGPFFVSGANVTLLESFPVQVRLEVSGQVPNPCYAPTWTVEDDGETLAIALSSVAPTDKICAEVLQEVEIVIPLGDWSDAQRTVTLNGETVGEFTT
ncbi:MAG: hypothetical protein OEW30_20705 [Acidimicrobiia bacterium]|nr:hypothetical protein [Acidimicrobiia bacterium]